MLGIGRERAPLEPVQDQQQRAVAAHPVVEVILLTGHGTIDTAVEGLKSGAFDYVQKPANFDELLDKLEAARLRKAEHEERIRRAEARILMRKSGDV